MFWEAPVYAQPVLLILVTRFCSGPRHRQPVYQWLYDWETHLPAGMLQTAAAAAGLPTMTDYAAMAATIPGMEHLQQWQEYQAAAAAAAAVGEAGAGCNASEAAHQQQQQLLQLAEYAAVQEASSAFWEQTAAAAQIQQQQQQSEQVPDDDLSAGATDAVQQRLQQVSVLVNTMLAEHGGKTCVTLSQLQGLLQQIQAGALHQDAAAVAAAVGQQQGQQYGDHDVASVDNQHEDQEQLDAAKCLQQLKAGAVWPEQPSISHQHQQQHAEDQNAQGSDDIRRSSKKRRVCTYPVPESNDQCCPGMTCLDFAAALRAVADSQLQQQPDSSVQQQSVGCRSPEEAGATKGSPATEDVCCVSTANGRARSHSCSKGNQVDADQDYAMFVAEEGEPGPGGRISSCSLNNSRDQSAMQELAAAAVASLQEQQQGQHTAADKPSSLDSNDDEAKTLQQQTVDTGCLGGLAAAVEQHQIEMAMPWVGASAAADRVKTGEPLDVCIATSVGTADSGQKVLSAGAQSAHPRQVLDLAQEDKQQRRIDVKAVSDSHNRDRMQSCAVHAAGPGMEHTADAAQQLHKAVSSRARDDQQQQGCLSSPWQALQQLQQLTSVHSETSNLAAAGGSDGGGECSQGNCAVMPVEPYALKGCTTQGSGWSFTMPTAATTSTAPGLLQCQEQLLHHSQQYPLAAGGGVAVQGLLNCLPANLLAQVLQAQAK